MRRRFGIGVGIGVALLALWWLTAGVPNLSGPGVTDRSPAADPRGAPGSGVAGKGPASGNGGGDPAGPQADTLDDAATAPPAELTDAQLAARAAELEAAPETQVVCDLGLPIRSGQAYLAIGGHSDGNGRLVEIVNGVAYMPLVYDLGPGGDVAFAERSGVFAVEGYGPAEISWTDRPKGGGKGTCTAKITPEPGKASLTGTLTLAKSGAPAAGGWVEGCGNLAFADDNGIVHMDIVDTPCAVVAMRQDGALRSVSDSVAVVPIPGHDVVIDFLLPDAPKAGLGIKVSAGEDGLQVDGVVDGGPAQAAGVESGDLVVLVDGQPADDLSLPEFVSLATGAAGTPLVLGVERDGQRLDLTIVRAPIPG